MTGKFSIFFFLFCIVALAIPKSVAQKKNRIENETKEPNEKYIRLWVDTKDDKYMRLGLNSKSVDYYNVGLFNSKVSVCESALWGVVNQVGQMQHALKMERKKNGKTKPGRHSRRKRSSQ